MLHLLQYPGDGRVAITHGETYHHIGAEALFHGLTDTLSLFRRVNQQGRTLLFPHTGIGFRTFPGADAENDAVQNQPPQGARYLDNPRIPEEFREVFPQGGSSRCVGGSKVGDQHTEPVRLIVAVVIDPVVRH